MAEFSGLSGERALGPYTEPFPTRETINPVNIRIREHMTSTYIHERIRIVAGP